MEMNFLWSGRDLCTYILYFLPFPPLSFLFAILETKLEPQKGSGESLLDFRGYDISRGRNKGKLSVEYNR